MSEDLTTFLAEVELFAELDAGDLERLASQLAVERLAAGAILFRQGDEGDHLYVVRSGELEVFSEAADGSEEVLARLGRGECVGEAALLGGERRNASVRAATDAELLALREDEFSRLVAESPGVRRVSAALLTRRLPWFRLATRDLFGELDEELRRDIESTITLVRLRRGETLFERGEPAHSMYVLLRGRLHVMSEGPEHRVLAEISGPETVGELGLLTREPRSATVVAARDSELVRLGSDGFEAILEHNPNAVMPLVRTIGQRLRQSSQSPAARSRPSTIAILPLGDPGAARWLFERLQEILARDGSVLALDEAAFDRLHGPGAAQTEPDHPRWLRLAEWLHHQEEEHEQILFLAEDPDSRWSRHCTGQSDRTLLVADSEEEPRAATLRQDDGSGPTVMLELVVVHRGGERPQDTARWLDLLSVLRHHHVRTGVPADAERLARFLRGRALGVVLGGGGARAFAHVGVQRAMEELGIEADYTCGVSMGALAAAFWASGFDWRETRDAFHRIFVATRASRRYSLPIFSVLDIGRAESRLEATYDGRMIEDLWLNFFCIASNITRGCQEVMASGSVFRAARASMSFPGLLPPVPRGGELLVDGGLFTNLPVKEMTDRLNGSIIACDVGRERDLSVDPEIERSPTTLEYLLGRLLPYRAPVDFPRIGPVLLRSVECREDAAKLEQQSLATVFLRPSVEQFSIVDFSRLDAIAEAAYRYALEELSEFASSVGS